MGKVIKKKIQGMSWWMKTSLVLLLTLATTVFMYEGWYKPRNTQAAVAAGSHFSATNIYTATGAANMTMAGTYTVGAGSNRVAIFVMQAEGGGATDTFTVGTATYGGQTITPLLSAGSGTYRNKIWIGYINEAGLAAATSTNVSIAFTFSVAPSAVALRGGWFTGVDQTTPINFVSSGNDAPGAATHTYGTALNVNNGGMAYYFETTNAGITYTPPTGYTEAFDANDASANFALTAGYKAIAATGTENPTITQSTVTRYTVAAIAINPSVVTGNLTIGAGTNPADANAGQGSTNNAIDGFSMAMSSGTGTVTTLTVTGDANFTAANIPTNGVKVYRDLGTVGTYDAGTDVLVSSASTAISGNATTVTISSEAVSTTATNYLVVVDLNAAASIGNTFTATISGAGGTGLGTVTDNDTTGATLTVSAGNVLTIGNGTTLSASNVPRSSSSVLDSFTMATSSGSGSITAITVTGDTNFTATNIGTNGVKIYRDAGTIGVLDGADTLISASSTAIAANATTVTLTTAESVTSTPQNYLVVVDVTATATLAQAFTGTISGVTGTGYVSVTDNDTTGATLTVTAAQTLTVGNGTNPANANVQTGATGTLDAFSLQLSTGTGTVSTLTLTGSANYTTANISSASVYADNGTVGTYEAGTDTLIASTYSQTGTAGTITLTSPESVTTAAKNYLVRVTVNGGATVGNTFTGMITAASGSGIGTPTYSDTASATLTITAGPVATISSCGGCHGNPPVDGTGRNTPSGQFQGDHTKHSTAPLSLTCDKCHGTLPATYTHSDGQITIASPLRGVTGESYGQATHAVSNSPIYSSCTTYCHSQGTSKTSNSGETRTTTLSTPLVTATWATTTTTCASCHGNPPSYTSGDTTWGAAKANSHQGTTHAATACSVCHTSVTGTGPYTLTTGHADGLYTVAPANITYTYAVSGGTCVGGAAAACHANATVVWGSSLGCIDCHNSVQTTSTATQALDATVTSRPIMTAGFILAQSHTRSRATPAATNEDCVVCHMEGDPATHTKNTAASPNGGTYHGNGYVELRDPDTGTTIKTKTHSGTTSAEGSWSADTANDAIFVRFKRNLGITLENETATIPGKTITNFQVLGGIMVNHCLKCHDSNGATSTNAQITGGSAFKPFGATVAANGTNQGVLDVSSQFASTNRSQHPVLVKNNNGYTNTSGTRLLAPWNASATKTGTTTVYGALISCWDCHAPNGSTTATTVTNTNAALVVDTHGRAKTVSTDAVELRGSVYLSSTTMAGNLCLNCHVVSGGTTLHGAGSAMQASTSNGSMTYFQNRCYFCHSGVETNAHAARPIGAGDAHGYNTTSAGAAITTGGRGYAFIRRTGLPQLAGQVGATTYTATCGSATGICTQGMGTYTPGGKF